MDQETQSSFCADSVRKNDPDRFILTMLAPSGIRESLFALYAFNLEIARTRELVSEPPLGEIRLQWWRDEVEAFYAGAVLRHGISNLLCDTIVAHALTRSYFDRLIDARSADLDDGPPDSIADLLQYAEETTVPLLNLALEIAGDCLPVTCEAARHVGIAWSLVGLVRALPFHLRTRRQYLPRELMQRHGVETHNLLDLKPSDGLNKIVRDVSEIAENSLREARRLRPSISRNALPILLQAHYAEIHLRCLERSGFDPFNQQLAAPVPMVAWRLAWMKFKGRY